MVRILSIRDWVFLCHGARVEFLCHGAKVVTLYYMKSTIKNKWQIVRQRRGLFNAGERFAFQMTNLSP